MKSIQSHIGSRGWVAKNASRLIVLWSYAAEILSFVAGRCRHSRRCLRPLVGALRGSPVGVLPGRADPASGGVAEARRLRADASGGVVAM